MGFYDCIDYVDVAGIKDVEEDAVVKYLSFYDWGLRSSRSLFIVL
jgi:hypothetical protein